MLTTQVIYPVKPASARQIEEAKKDLADLIGQYGVEIHCHWKWDGQSGKRSLCGGSSQRFSRSQLCYRQ